MIFSLDRPVSVIHHPQCRLVVFFLCGPTLPEIRSHPLNSAHYNVSPRPIDRSIRESNSMIGNTMSFAYSLSDDSADTKRFDFVFCYCMAQHGSNNTMKQERRARPTYSNRYSIPSLFPSGNFPSALTSRRCRRRPENARLCARSAAGIEN